jgi:hypothetical protein
MRVASYLVALSVFGLVQLASAQKNTPKPLLQILHCAETDKFGRLAPGLKKTDTLQVGWHRSLDPDPEIGEEFFIVLYKSAREGDVLVYVRDFERGRVKFSLVNNARFAGGPDEFKLIDPLGGIWTYNHIKRNVAIAMRNRKYSIQAKSLLGSYVNVGCHFYSDPD